MKNALTNLYSCADNVQDYFRALGGSNQYPSFMNWHIPAFLLLVLEDKSESELLPSDIWKSAKRLQESIRLSLLECPPSKEDIKEFLDITTQATSKFKSRDEALGWNNFCKAMGYM